MVYKLKLSCQWQWLHPVFNVVKLIATLEDPILEQKIIIPSIPVIVNSEVKWKVEEILNSR